MKNTLAENMMRFGTKNLSEADLQNLTEADAPKPGYAFPADTKFDGARKLGVKFKGRVEDPTNGSFDEYGPFVVQSATSITEASAILQELMKILGKSGTENSAAIAAALKKITGNNYYAILWKVNYGTSFRASTGSSYGTVTDWISKKGFDIPSATGAGRGTTSIEAGSDLGFFNDPAGNIIGGIRNLSQDPTIFNAVNRLQKYNIEEGRMKQ
jgi:hypothetical protein